MRSKKESLKRDSYAFFLLFKSPHSIVQIKYFHFKCWYTCTKPFYMRDEALVNFGKKSEHLTLWLWQAPSPRRALFSLFKNRIRCNLFASTANLTLKTLTACTADTHGCLPTSKKLCNSNALTNRDNRLSIRYLHIYQQQQQYTASAKKFPNLIQGLNTWS